MRKLVVPTLVLIAATFLAGIQLASAAEGAAFPELKAFHDLVAKLWHTYYPTDNWKAARELAPDLVKAADALAKAPLPADVKNRQKSFDEKAKYLSAIVADYAEVAQKTDDGAMKKATVKLHEAFHELVTALYSQPKTGDNKK
jgi:hypothetical protein